MSDWFWVALVLLLRFSPVSGKVITAMEVGSLHCSAQSMVHCSCVEGAMSSLGRLGFA